MNWIESNQIEGIFFFLKRRPTDGDGEKEFSFVAFSTKLNETTTTKTREDYRRRKIYNKRNER